MCHVSAGLWCCIRRSRHAYGQHCLAGKGTAHRSTLCSKGSKQA
jgi:hypothetical protein